MADSRDGGEPKPGQRDAVRRKAQNHFAAHDERSQLVKDLAAKENAATDAKTAKLRALRLAKEEADRQEAVRQAAADARAVPKVAKTGRAKIIRV